jgi:hypothetical protein
MSETSENVAKAAENTANAATEAVKAERAPVRKAVTLLKRNPLGVVALVGAAAALIEIELAVGILAGIGATALLTLKTGPEARQEVLTKGKWAIERARSLTVRAKDQAEATTQAAAPAATPESSPSATPAA